MIKDYIQAGYPALCVLTQEPHRAEELLQFEDKKFQFVAWDCMHGIRSLADKRLMDEIRDPVEAINWLGRVRNTIMIAHNLHLFMDLPEVIQAILNGLEFWKRVGNTLIMVSPIIQMRTEIEKFFHVIELKLPDDNELFGIQLTLREEYKVKPNRKAARSARGLTKFEAETAYALSLTKCGYFSTRVISEAKKQMIHKSGLMQFWEHREQNINE